MAKPFVHLHLHTEYSLLDGAARIDGLMERVKENGQDAVAITDHGVMYGCVDFFKAARAAGVKPVIGCEAYVANRTRFDKVSHMDGNHHLVLLCKNAAGYANLATMISQGFTEGFYSKPRIDKDLLKKHSEGLICLSACLAGEIPQLLLSGDYAKAKETALWYDELFGRGNYYIEIQDHGIPEQQTVLPGLIRLSKETGIPLVATNDAHYLRKEDSKMQRVLVCIQTGKTVDDEDKLEFETDEFYVKSSDEMYELFAAVPEACANTARIAEMCDFEFDFGHTKLPAFAPPNGMGSDEYFRSLCDEGLRRHYGDAPGQEVLDRLEYEISVISGMGYTNYYLIVADFIAFARSKGIPVGPGRGSGAGSLAAYCMGITDIDPIKYNLLFERFLNPERISMPDFDVDFCYERRQEVIDYVIDKYGEDHVAQIITFGTMAARAAIRDVGRVLGIPYQKVDTVAKMVPMELKMTLRKALRQSKQLAAEYDNDPQVRELIDFSMKIEGMPRHASTHAAGVVITPGPTSDYVPLSTNDGAVVTQYPMGTIEELGLLKMDFLGLRTLTVISDAERMIRRHTPDFSIADIPYDDAKVYEFLSTGNTFGIFQLESGGMRQTLINLRPENIEDVIALVSLYRPGPMDSIPTYVANRHNLGKVSYKTPQLEPILSVTYGCIVYQEQVMQICRELGGFTLAQADLVRRAMSKKKHDVMEKERLRFVKGCAKNGISQSVAESIFDDMTSFASYAFNKSHAAAYAVVAYQTAYLKWYYAKEFMAALLTSVLEQTTKVTMYITECQRLGIHVLPPDINVSLSRFTVHGKDIRYGLLALKNVGAGLIAAIEGERQRAGDFKSFYDFCKRMHGPDLNRRALESLVKSGAFDRIEPNRHAMVNAIEGIMKSVENNSKKNLEGQLDMFGAALAGGQAPAADTYPMPNVPEYTKDELLQQEKEVSGLYLSGHPLQQHMAVIQRVNSCTIGELLDEGNDSADGRAVTFVCTISKIKFFTTKSGDPMAFTTVEDLTGSIEVLIFPKVLQEHVHLVRENAAVILSGRTSVREDEEPKVLADRLQSVDGRLAQTPPDEGGVNKLYLKVPSKTSEEYRQATNLLTIFSGRIPVCIRYSDTGKMLQNPPSLWAAENETLLRELKRVLGDSNVATR